MSLIAVSCAGVGHNDVVIPGSYNSQLGWDMCKHPLTGNWWDCLPPEDIKILNSELKGCRNR